MSKEHYVQVALDVPALPILTYKAGEGEPRVGDRCVVPLGARRELGLIVGMTSHIDIDEKKCKSYLRLINEIEPLSTHWLKFTKFAADYYQHTWGEVALANLPQFFRSKPGPRYAMSLAKLREPFKAVKVKQVPELTLNDEQARAVEVLKKHSGFGAFVLHGVTGSGKTEVYLRMMESVFKDKPQAQILFLVPEINLTPQLEGRVRSHFPDKAVVTMHSGLSQGQRAKAWLAMHEKRAQILIGTRMAIFASIPELSLVLVDEEHDLSYKAGDGIRYSARDLAVKRAQMLAIPVVLGSATPSLETWANVRAGHYNLLTLTKRAVQAAVMPQLRVIDPRHCSLIKGISTEIVEAVSDRLSRGEQCIIFLNRRGYAPVITCASCGWLSKCPHCSTYAVYHKDRARLICHHCGWSHAVYSRCPDCGNVDLIPMGAGTQRIEETIAHLWPEARILRIDRDSTQRKDAAEKAFASVHAGEVDILVGTQMVAKGHDFQNVTLVVVLNIDAQLVSANPRGEERAFANLMQVAGRAGRAGSRAEILVQSRFGDKLIFRALAAQDYCLFADRLLQERKDEYAAPFVSQALLTADATDIDKALEFLRLAVQQAEIIRNRYEDFAHVTVYDPIPMALMRVADRERAQLLVEADTKARLNRFLRLWYPAVVSLKSAVRWTMDVDPVDV